MTILRVENLGKAYRHYPSRVARLLEWMWPARPRHQLHWMLRGLSFEVEAGASLGIIGRNGAGKSTLLKLITGTTQPTEGRVELNGRVAALLELGMGFHPEFSGRANVFMAGQLLGLSTEEITEALPDIERFAEIGRYLDEPVRTYSSGMQVRLAFAVATAVRPEVLIVDEALAVGDLYFQHKCYARIRAFREAGTTLLFVSHDAGAIRSLCERALLLEDGRLLTDGAPDRVLEAYNALVARQEADTHAEAAEGQRSGDKRAEILEATLLADGAPVRAVRVDQAVELAVRLRLHAPLEDLTAGFLIRDRFGNELYGTNTWHLGLRHPPRAAAGAVSEVRFAIPALHLGPGSYSVTVALHSQYTHLEANHDWWERALVFEVTRADETFFSGYLHLDGVHADWREATA